MKKTTLVNIAKELISFPPGKLARSKFYSTVCGWCSVQIVNPANPNSDLITVAPNYDHTMRLDCFGRAKQGGECLLFPDDDGRDWEKFIEVESFCLRVDSPIMCTPFLGSGWVLRYYAGNGKVYVDGCDSRSADDTEIFNWMIPVKFFNFDNPSSEDSLSHNIRCK